MRKKRNGWRQIVYNEVVPGAEWVINGEGVPTEKIDGTCCLFHNGRLWRRYDRKRNKKTGKHKPAPEGWIAAEDAPDPNTGHSATWTTLRRCWG